MGTYVITLPILRVAVGESFTTLPLQCSVFQYFSIADPLETLCRELRMIAKHTVPIELVGGKPALFGPNNDVPVHLIEPSPQLRDLHDAVGRLLADLNAHINNPEWAGNGYRPHATNTQLNTFASGSRAVIDHMAVVERRANDQKKEIRSLIWFGR